MKYILGLLIAFVLCACNKEDWPDNSQQNINFFAVPEDAVGEEAELRRDFFKETGVYLLFNDTLGIRETSALSGEKVSEYKVLNLMFDMFPAPYDVDSLDFSFYKTIAEQKAAVKFLKEEVLTNISEWFLPYSLLLVDKMTFFDNYYDISYIESDIPVYCGLQATAIALGDIAIASEEEKTVIKNSFIQEMVIFNIAKIADEDWANFCSYSQEYYDILQFNVPSPVQSVGFLETYAYDWTVSFNSKKYDLDAYVREIFLLTETEFRETYADYPMVIDKMEEMVNVLRKYGVKVYE